MEKGTVVANRDLISGSMYVLTLNFEIPHYFFMKKLPLFIASYHVIFQCGR